ncbi:MAG: DUF499 domain-containing protein [Actinomycetota bacterium]|nr:DUF499 domain-containing protein [Actinomycetota bacterium]
MSPVRPLRPWNTVVQPHADIREGRLEMGTYAADLGRAAAGDANLPVTYRDATEFFRTTYLTRNLRQLLTDVLNVLRSGAGDRVIQLRTPFGGGKTHSLLALYHLVKHRSSIDAEITAELPDPGTGAVVVLSGLGLDPRQPRHVEGLELHTLWGELAYQIGGRDGYERVRQQDHDWAAPGGDVLSALIGTRPTLILLDEVLQYVTSASGGSGTDPRRRQVMGFLQKLTETVKASRNAAMIYSLQASVHEAGGDEALLRELEHLVGRVDRKREPVADDELVRVVQRRLFPDFRNDPEHLDAARDTAREYERAYRKVREGYAQTTSERRAAGADTERFGRRIIDSYPFHPDLLDLMYHRWGSLPSYQRTRGALQFLATVVAALWNDDAAVGALIGPGDVPFDDDGVRSAFFTQVGEARERYMSVLAADVSGDEARAKRIDKRFKDELPKFGPLTIGTRVAAAVMMYSFGGRPGEDKGVVEADLVQALSTPELDRTVLTSALHDLREQLIYLHWSGRRYRFEPKANLNLLIDEAARPFDTDEVDARLESEVRAVLASDATEAIVWPNGPDDIPDKDAVFRVAYLPPDTAGLDDAERRKHIAMLLDTKGAERRSYRNALAFAVPVANGLDRARVAARQALGLDQLDREVRAKRVELDDDQRHELQDRRSAVAKELRAAAEQLYQLVLVPVPDKEGSEPFAFDAVDLRAQLGLSLSLHRRVLEGLRKHVFTSVTPARVAQLIGLGTARTFAATHQLMESFFTDLGFPKLRDAEAVRAAIGLGARDTFGYVTAADVVDGALVATQATLVRVGQPVDALEIDFGPGSFVTTIDLAHLLRGAGDAGARPADAAAPTGGPAVGEAPPAAPADEDKAPSGPTRYRLRATLDASQLFRVLPGLQHLAEKSDVFRVGLDVNAEAAEPFAPGWIRNAVEEHFDEAGVDIDTSP